MMVQASGFLSLYVFFKYVSHGYFNFWGFAGQDVGRRFLGASLTRPCSL